MALKVVFVCLLMLTVSIQAWWTPSICQRAVNHHSLQSPLFEKVGIESSTPTRTKPKRKTGVEKDTEDKDKVKPERGFVVKESRSIADEIEAYFAEDNYMVLLYNDPFNKRAYVSSVLQDVFKWDEIQADAVMLQAHTYGYAVTVETSQERAEEYVEKLLEKGLLAEARKAGDPGGDDGE